MDGSFAPRAFEMRVSSPRLGSREISGINTILQYVLSCIARIISSSEPKIVLVAPAALARRVSSSTAVRALCVAPAIIYIHCNSSV